MPGALGVAIGIVLGGTQALARSYFSLLIPRGKEAEEMRAGQMPLPPFPVRAKAAAKDVEEETESEESTED